VEHGEQAGIAVWPSLLVLAALLCATSVLALRLLRGALARLAPAREAIDPRWGLPHALIVLGAYLMLIFGAAVVLSVFGVTELGGLAALLLTLAVQGSLVLLICAFVHALHGGVRPLGIASDASPRSVLFGFLLYAAAAPGLFGVLLAWSRLLDRLGIDAPAQSITELAGELQGAALVGFAVLIVVVIPLCEELIFRGFLQPLLVRKLGVTGGLLATGVLFAVPHRNLSASVPILVLALVLGTIMQRTQRIAGSWFVHGLHNAVTLVIVVWKPH
jgi:membrane protease YdiL (CAAX protease family)